MRMSSSNHSLSSPVLETARASGRPRLAGLVIAAGAMCACYYLSALLGILLSFASDHRSVFWPPNAVLLAALLLAAPRYWWLFLLSGLPAQLAVELNAGVPVGTSIGFYSANCVQAVVAAGSLKLLGDGLSWFQSLRHAGLCVLCAAVLAPAVSAFVGAGIAMREPSPDAYMDVWLTWFLGGATVHLAVTPLVPAWADFRLSDLRSTSIWRWLEAALLAASMIFIGLFAMGSNLHGLRNLPALFYIPLPGLLWAATRFGPRGISTTIFGLALLSIWNTIQGRGAFTTMSTLDNVLSLQLFLIFISVPLILIVSLIRERQASAQAMVESERRLAEIIQTVPCGVILVDRNSRIIFANPAAEEVFGVPQQDLVGRSCHDPAWSITTPDSQPIAEQDLPSPVILRTGIPINNAEFAVVQPSGRRVILTINAAPRLDRAGRTVGMVAAITDITERRSAEQEKQRLEHHLRQAQKMEALGQLAGGIAHDFNNLLTIIGGYSESILTGRLAPDAQAQAMQQVVSATDRARDLTRQILAFSRQQVLQTSVLNINDELPEVLRLISRLIGEHIVVQTRLAPDLGNVRADRSQLQQVLMNLALNARDAMPDGGKLLIETANAHLDQTYAAAHAELRPGRYVMLAVSDTGCGMDAATVARIFEPFFTTKVAGRGTGLGLATAFGIIRQHDGHISVYSEPGVGTTFRVYLPCVDEPVSSGAPAPAAGPQAHVASTILLVEDEPMLRKLVHALLADQGHTLLEASSAAEALRLSDEHQGPIELLVTDVVMPGMSGPELYRRLCQTRPQIRVLYMSGYTDGMVEHQGVDNAETAFIQKPFKTNTLLEKVRQALAHGG